MAAKVPLMLQLELERRVGLCELRRNARMGDGGMDRRPPPYARSAYAPNGRIVAVDLAAPDPESWVTLVAETEHALEWSAALAGELLVNHLVEASARLTRYSTDGTELGPLPLPGLGTITGLAGRFAEPAVFLGYQSFVEPPTVLRAEDGVTEVWWETMAALERGMSSPAGVEAQAKLIEDEARFIYLRHSRVFMTEEHQIF